ncbi:hypothetical protein EON81_16795 [bacterium]|nr:MAG: hypothetical protein EON81_16795 [bacterium]
MTRGSVWRGLGFAICGALAAFLVVFARLGQEAMMRVEHRLLLPEDMEGGINAICTISVAAAVGVYQHRKEHRSDAPFWVMPIAASLTAALFSFIYETPSWQITFCFFGAGISAVCGYLTKRVPPPRGKHEWRRPPSKSR